MFSLDLTTKQTNFEMLQNWLGSSPSTAFSDPTNIQDKTTKTSASILKRKRVEAENSSTSTTKNNVSLTKQLQGLHELMKNTTALWELKYPKPQTDTVGPFPTDLEISSSTSNENDFISPAPQALYPIYGTPSTEPQLEIASIAEASLALNSTYPTYKFLSDYEKFKPAPQLTSEVEFFLKKEPEELQTALKYLIQHPETLIKEILEDPSTTFAHLTFLRARKRLAGSFPYLREALRLK